MIELLVRKLSRRDDLSACEVTALEKAVSRVDELPRGAEVVAEGSRQTSSRLLLDGWVARANVLENGRRQLTELHVPGDFVDLHSFGLKKMDHSVIALTPVRIASVPHEALLRITETLPHLTRMLWLSTLLDASIHRQWIAVMGQLLAVERIAHLLCELYVRLELTGLACDHGFELPLTQETFGEACGLTGVHVNRSLQQLRESGLVRWQRGHVTTLDWPRLTALAQFDPTYLNLDKEPR